MLEEEQETISPDMLEILQKLAQDSVDLEPYLTDLNSAFDGVYPPPHCITQFPAINSKYSSVISKLDAIIRQSQRVLATLEGDITAPPISGLTSPRCSAAHSQRPSRSPSVASMHFLPATRMVDYFMSQELPRVGMPFPPLCGAIQADPNEPLAVATFVAGKIGEDWVLCYIVSYDNGGYYICDAESDQSAAFFAERKNIVPLPTSLPNRITKTTEFAAQTRVFALWPEQNVWTSVFYGATVMKPPSETQSCYKLLFEMDNPKPVDVPQQFVIAAPE